MTQTLSKQMAWNPLSLADQSIASDQISEINLKRSASRDRQYRRLIGAIFLGFSIVQFALVLQETISVNSELHKLANYQVPMLEKAWHIEWLDEGVKL